MNKFPYNLLNNWHFVRFVRLGIGIYAATQAYEMHDPFLAVISAFLLFQAITNTGCAGAGACAPMPSQRQQNDLQNTSFEEIK